MRLGIMQGRLVPPEDGRFQSFPRTNWRLEFELARLAGLDSIEWIYDTYGESVNPIATDDGLAEMLDLSRKHGIAIASLCADYFMDRPIVRADSTQRRDLADRLHWLIGRCKQLGIGRIVLPFVDASTMQDETDERCAVEFLVATLPAAVKASVELHLETDLSPADFKRFLDRIRHPSVKVNYDSGNSASLGYDPVEEFASYGESVGSVHIKDRKLGASTVPLGTGDANLPAVFDELARLGYAGDFILQAARAKPGAEVMLARENLAFVRASIARASHAARAAAP